MSLSRHPSLVDDHLEGRHIDLRPFVLSGERVEVIPGGLTRVAMRTRLAGGQLVAGRRVEGHLGARRRARDPTTSGRGRPSRRPSRGDD